MALIQASEGKVGAMSFVSPAPKLAGGESGEAVVPL